MPSYQSSIMNYGSLVAIFLRHETDPEDSWNEQLLRGIKRRLRFFFFHLFVFLHFFFLIRGDVIIASVTLHRSVTPGLLYTLCKAVRPFRFKTDIQVRNIVFFYVKLNFTAFVCNLFCISLTVHRGSSIIADYNCLVIFLNCVCGQKKIIIFRQRYELEAWLLNIEERVIGPFLFGTTKERFFPQTPCCSFISFPQYRRDQSFRYLVQFCSVFDTLFLYSSVCIFFARKSNNRSNFGATE